MDDNVAESVVLEAINDVLDAAFETIKENKLKKVRGPSPPCVRSATVTHIPVHAFSFTEDIAATFTDAHL